MLKKEYNLDDFFFNLPDELIAQNPLPERDLSRLFVINKSTGEFLHGSFRNFQDFINQGDVLVFNDTKVLNSRIYCKRKTGGKIELVLIKPIDDYRWLAVSNRHRRLIIGEKLYPLKCDSLAFEVVEKNEDTITINTGTHLNAESLKGIGDVPLPPYIKRNPEKSDFERYQTVYASHFGAVASPTAGLHFTDDMLKKITNKGAVITFLTLHVSWGTFMPVRTKNLVNHRMHSEKFILPESTAVTINNARKAGSRIIAIGTTSLRVLESTYNGNENIPGTGETDIFIFPPRDINSVNALLTNFHTPYSTLLMLVSAFAGYETIMSAYKNAVENRYRFFSYGDSMLII
ncbi:MAG: tRNA preQ1(34) S-adenosylmethionine ribosyltransferase-isomerase QueA [Spirochaetes bacterium]|jgi:S-adenosylmethionine:tRNA ribosyltransferase-isomerase|nr:tRNA preQ1(34) S-adenosylmethionine ribosyltransferase-isomerase QueA [Spirochaetota bacterium]